MHRDWSDRQNSSPSATARLLMSSTPATFQAAIACSRPGASSAGGPNSTSSGGSFSWATRRRRSPSGGVSHSRRRRPSAVVAMPSNCARSSPKRSRSTTVQSSGSSVSVAWSAPSCGRRSPAVAPEPDLPGDRARPDSSGTGTSSIRVGSSRTSRTVRPMTQPRVRWKWLASTCCVTCLPMAMPSLTADR